MNFMLPYNAIIFKGIITYSRYRIELISGLIANLLIGFGVAFGISAITGYGGKSFILGFLVWMLYSNVSGTASYGVGREAAKGTLQRQLATPIGTFGVILPNIFVSIIYSVFSLSIILTTAYIIGYRYHFDINISIFILIFSMPFFIGLALFYSGVTLIFKKTETLVGLINVSFLGLAVVASGDYPSFLAPIFRWFPYTQLTIILNRMSVGGNGFDELAVELIPLGISSIIFLIIGVLGLNIGDRITRKLGILNQY